MSKGRKSDIKNYTDAEKLEILQLYDKLYNGNQRQTSRQLKDKGYKFSIETLRNWIKDRGHIEKSVNQIAQVITDTKGEENSVDIAESNSVRIARHEQTVINAYAEAELEIIKKLRKHLDNNDMTKSEMFKFLEKIDDRFGTIKGKEKPGTPLFQQNNFQTFISQAKEEMVG